MGKALRELTAQEFKVDLRRLDLNPDANAWVTDTALMEIKVSKRSDSDNMALFQK